MWCLKIFREHQGRAVEVRPRAHNQIFQDREFLIDCLDELPQILNWEGKAEVADAMTLLESKQYPLFIFCGDAIVSVIDSERKGG
jgi:hypothetical protein